MALSAQSTPPLFDKLCIHLIAGARPNFMKVGPLYHALLNTTWAEPILVHTGQHYSFEMSDVFLRDLRLPSPHFHLDASGKTHAELTGAVMIAYESLCIRNRPDWVVVVGDINSTIAATLAAKKLDLPVAHLEAGLRSGDRTMPEEINRLMIDAVSDIFWTPSEDADANLLREGISPDKIFRVGNIMIDAYCLMQDSIDKSQTINKLKLVPMSYALVTMHRPVNVDYLESLVILVDQLIELSNAIKVVFPVHPRTRSRLNSFGLTAKLIDAGILLLEPLGYIEFMNLVANCRLVITDSGGIQEETSYLGIPCLTARDSTERPVTLTLGSNQLISVSHIAQSARTVIEKATERIGTSIPLWDGNTAQRIVDSLFKYLRKGV